MKWTTVHSGLLMTDRRPSGYEYRILIALDGSALLIAEGPVSGKGYPTHRRRFDDEWLAKMAAERWEGESERPVARSSGAAPIISFTTS